MKFKDYALKAEQAFKNGKVQDAIYYSNMALVYLIAVTNLRQIKIAQQRGQDEDS